MISISPCLSPKVEKTGVNFVSDPLFINPLLIIKFWDRFQHPSPPTHPPHTNIHTQTHKY